MATCRVICQDVTAAGLPANGEIAFRPNSNQVGVKDGGLRLPETVIARAVDGVLTFSPGYPGYGDGLPGVPLESNDWENLGWTTYKVEIPNAGGRLTNATRSFFIEVPAGQSTADLIAIMAEGQPGGGFVTVGLTGPPPELVSGDTITLPPGSPAEFTFTEIAEGTYRVDSAVGSGEPGDPAGSDAATAGFIEDGPLTTAALATVVDESVDSRAAALVAHASAAPSPLMVYHSNGDVLIRTKFTPTRDLLMPFSLDGPNANGQPRVVFISPSHPTVQTINSTALDGDVWPVVNAPAGAQTIHIPNDDTAPLYSEGFLVGGNHAYSFGATKVTVAAHGKTDADRGSQWSDGTNTYTLARIIDANNIMFLHNYQDLSAGRSRLVIAQPAATLTHTSGASDTTSVPVTTKAYVELTEVAHSRTVDARVDGFPLIEGTMPGTALTITETYTLATFKGIVQWARSHIGDDPFSETALSEADPLCQLTNTFTVTRAQIVVGQSVTARSPFAARMNVTQATAMTVPSGGTLRQYMPGVGTISGFNLSTFADITTVPANVYVKLADTLQAADPATRMTQWAHNSGGARQWGQAVGILPVVDGKRAARRANGVDATSWFFSNLKKNYPQLAWDRVLTTGQTLTGRAYRRYLAPDAPPELLVEDLGRQWLMIDTPDAHATEQTAVIPKAIGRTVIPDGTSTVTLSDTPIPGLQVGYTNTAPGYLLAEAVIPD